MSIEQKSALWTCVLAALENERCLDLRYKEQMADNSATAGLPNYKVMKQIALRSRLGVLYGPFIGIALIWIPVQSVWQWLLAILVSIFGPHRTFEAHCHVVPTTPTNIDLIKSAISRSTDISGEYFDVVQPSALSTRIRPSGVVRCIIAHIQLLVHILRREQGKRIDLILHSRDAFALSMLTWYARMQETHSFVSDDHYQRWAYLLSHNSHHFSIVQHGFLDVAIQFKNRFGALRHLHVRDKSFVTCFEQYFEVHGWSLFSPPRSLDSRACGDAIFLASSFPSIDAEIELIRALKKQCNVPILVKFHPSHQYDDRRRVLASLASAVITEEKYPACKVFVSYNSFMEFDYRALQISTVSIARAGGASEAAAAIMTSLRLESSRAISSS